VENLWILCSPKTELEGGEVRIQTDIWEQIKDLLKASLPWESYQSWFSHTTLVEQQGEQVVVSVPDQDSKEWIEKEFTPHIRQAIFRLGVPVRDVIFKVGESRAPSLPQVPANGTADLAPTNDPFFGPAVQLNAKYTFDSFVVGSCNQFAHAAARAVVEKPARSYNPLFIYGGVGMGKTHLIQAVGHELSERRLGIRVVYTTGERFMNQLINCIRTDRLPLFHQYYRSADVLLVDDVHIVAGRERTQEEFFHTFNELYDHQKQIVLSSDTAPKNISGLVDRLRSRFEWGLLVDVQAPDLETKMAILDKKAELEGIQLREDVRIFIATKTKSNVRELEGALIKLIAYSSVTQAPVTLDMAKQVLRNLSGASDKRITIEAVVKSVAERFQIQPSHLKLKSNEKRISYPRQVAMFLAKELTQASLPEIGRAFGGKHHTTVLHSIHKIERMRHHDPDLNRLINSVIDSFH
jgi:chromosomal replication initiator protein